MREKVSQREKLSRTLDSNPRAANQAQISEILQAYKDRSASTVQLTMQAQSVQINDDGVEKEADGLLQFKRTNGVNSIEEIVQFARVRKPNSRKVDGDGDCLYTAVALGLGTYSGVLRRHAAAWFRYIAGNRFNGFFAGLEREEVARTIETPGAWAGGAGDFAPRILAEALGIHLIIWQGRTIIQDYNHGQQVVEVLYNGTNHYDYVDGYTEGEEEVFEAEEVIEKMKEHGLEPMNLEKAVKEHAKRDPKQLTILLTKAKDELSKIGAEKKKEESSKAEFDKDGAPTKTNSGLDVKYANENLRRFYANYDFGKNKILEIRGAGTRHKKGTTKGLTFHVHIEGRDAVEYMINGNTITITGYGVKSNSAGNSTGGYDWNERP